jgi:hypothetical protein
LRQWAAMTPEEVRLEWTYPSASARLEAALAFVNDPLPRFRALASGAGVNEGADEIRALVTGALDELANVPR